MINHLNIALRIICLSTLGLVTSGCSSERLDVDVSDIEVKLKVERFDQELFLLDESKLSEQCNSFYEKYDFIFESFMMRMIGFGAPYDPMAQDKLVEFVKNDDVQELSKEIASNFSNFEQIETELTEAFKHYKYYFQDSTIPRIVTFYSNFNANVFPYENTLGIGLDMYLGSDHKFVQTLPNEHFPAYLKVKMDKQYIVADAMKAWLMNRFAKGMGDDLLSNIISLGKVMYLLDAMMPTEEDYIKFGCTKEQITWCVNFENKIWEEIVGKNLLYSKKQDEIMPLITDGPFTHGMPRESPSRVGIWLGWQIVRDYMNYNEDVTIEDLIKETNPKKILKSYSQGKRE